MTQDIGADQGESSSSARLMSFLAMPMRGRNRLAALFICALAGCAASPDPTIGVRFAQADLAYGQGALDHAVAGFIGPKRAGGANSGGVFGGNDTSRAGRDTKARADIDYRAIKGRELALMVGVQHPVSEGWHVDGTLRLGQGRVDYVLPAGSLRVPLGSFAVIIDEPVTLRARTRFIEGEALAFRRVAPRLPGQLELGAGGGVRLTDSRLQVQTETLFPIKIDSHHRARQPYGAVQARYRLAHLPARGFVEGRVYGRKTAGLRAGVDLTFP